MRYLAAQLPVSDTLVIDKTCGRFHKPAIHEVSQCGGGEGGGEGGGGRGREGGREGDTKSQISSESIE